MKIRKKGEFMDWGKNDPHYMVRVKSKSGQERRFTFNAQKAADVFLGKAKKKKNFDSGGMWSIWD